MLFDILKRKAANFGDTDFRAYRNLFADALCIGIFFVTYILQFYLVVNAGSRVIVLQTSHRAFASVKTSVEKLCIFFLVGFSYFVLETSTSEVFVKSFKSFHFSFGFYWVNYLA